MCGIAGLIHRGKSSNVGSELQGMLQALKHRGEDSTGYALYGDTDGKNFIMRFKVGENVGEGSSSIVEDVSDPELEKKKPTLFDNKIFVRTFDVITKSQGIPKKGESDPTPMIALMWPIFYGLMFASYS